MYYNEGSFLPRLAVNDRIDIMKKIFIIGVLGVILNASSPLLFSQESTNEIQIGNSVPAESKKPKLLGVDSFMEIFGSELALNVSLADVILLVILTNLFALFRKPRLILAISYLFCLKWVFWSNYIQLLQHSDTLAKTSTFVFVICGILTTVLFCMDRFHSSD